PAGWDIPQEEDIAMAILTQMSPYMLSADPDRFDYLRAYWDLSELTAADFAYWRENYLTYLKRVTYKDPLRRQLVLKSPVNTLRIPILLELFPDAKFVCIQRNPYDVFNSSVHLRQTLMLENCLGRPELRDLEESIYWVHEFVFRTYQRDRDLIPSGHLHEIRFEDVEADPVGQLQQVYRALDLGGWDEMREIIEPQVPALRRYKKNVFQDTPERMQRIYDRLEFIFEHYGYPSPMEAAAEHAAA
ncbi:MAG: sulfotransferase, partial [Planctomycetaceae bacterium]|nr:sulfotransferase [Planctomycetaceae bacterium]